MPTNCWTSTWHKLEFRLAWNFPFLERTGRTIRCTGRCQILVAVCLHSLLEVRKVCGVPSHRWVKRVLAWTPPRSRNGIKNWLLIIVTKILEIGWMLLKTSTGRNLIWTTSSTSAGFECEPNFFYILCNLFTCHFFFTPVPNGARHSWRTGSTRLDSTKSVEIFQKCIPSDDGISLPLAMVPNFCIDKKLGFDSPRCAVSFPRIGIGQMVSAIFKKQTPASCENYRPIPFVIIGHQLFATRLLRTLTLAGADATIWPTQLGFSTGWRCANALFVARPLWKRTCAANMVPCMCRSA